MRAVGLLIFLLILVAVIGSRPVADVGVLLSSVAPSRTVAIEGGEGHWGEGHWRYSGSAPFHGIVSENVREFQSGKPAEVAVRVCNDLGGELEHIEQPRPSDTAIGFLCRFTEPDVTMSLDFGDLSRIPSN